MEEKVRRLIEWSKGKKVPPLTIELNITNKCNLKCRFCWLMSANPEYEELSDEELVKIVKEAFGLGVEEFRFPGSGEPLLRKEILFTLMKMIKANRRTGLLITNGTLFEEHDIEDLIKIKWDILTISLHAPDSKTHNYLTRVKGSFERVIENLEYLKELRKKFGVQNPWLRMNVVLNNKNYDKLKEIVELGKEFEFNEIILQPMTVFSKEGEKLKVDIESVSDHLKEASKRADELKIKTNFRNFIRNFLVEKTNQMEELIQAETKKFTNDFLKIACYEPFYNLIIMPDGKAGPCAIAGGKTNASMKKKSLKEVWFGNEFQNFRERLKRGELFPFCSHCCVPIFLENKRLRSELAKWLG